MSEVVPNWAVLGFRVLVLHEGPHYVVQDVDHDITAQGRTLAQALERFGRIMACHVQMDIDDGQPYFDTQVEAPRAYWEEFDRIAKQSPQDRDAIRMLDEQEKRDADERDG